MKRREPSAKELADREAFERQRSELLADVPTEFHSALRSLAWEQGHSAGYGGVLGDLGELVYRLKPAIAAFQRSLTNA